MDTPVEVPPEPGHPDAAAPPAAAAPVAGALPRSRWSRLSATARRQVVAVAVFLVVALLFNTAFLVAIVHGESMLPSYHDGQMVLVRRLGVFGHALHRGDVVVVDKSGDYIIKRVAYLPGDTIRGWQARSFWRVREFFDVALDPVGGLTLKVPAGNFVVLGDNRAVSDDSRSFGPVRARDILGTAVNEPSLPQP